MKRIIPVFLCVLILVFSLVSCGSEEASSATESANASAEAVSQVVEDSKEEKTALSTIYPVTVEDQLGNSVTISQKPNRIVSGYYISTSACLALGLKDKLVGIEEKAASRPLYSLVCSELIESAVNVGSAKAFDVEACISANPDLVILPKKAKDYAQTLKELNIPVIIVNPESDELLDEMLSIIAIATDKGEELLTISGIYGSLADKVSEIASKATTSPKVYMCAAGAYLATCGKNMYQSGIIRSVGATCVADVFDTDSKVDVSYEQLLELNPEVMIIPTNTTANGNTSYTKEDIMADSQLAELSAVKSGRIYTMPYGYEAWDSPVPSGILGKLWLASVLYPELYTKEEFAADVSNFYKDVYGVTVDTANLFN